ncbi:MAG: hypothetical protein AAF655_23630 [Bacteroidota bacterium]
MPILIKKVGLLSVWLGFTCLSISCGESSQGEEKQVAAEQVSPTEQMRVVQKQEAYSPILSAPVDHYICYTNDEGTTGRIMISFTEEGKVLWVQYEGQSASIALAFEREETHDDGIIYSIDTYYQEIYEEKVNGQYKLTHSGNWDYVRYTRGKDGKEFRFTIDHDANPYGSSPCF